MIVSFRHKALREFFETGKSAGVDSKLQERLRVRLDALHAATKMAQLNRPGFDFHSLRGKPQRHTIHVNGPWCITFEWSDIGAARVALEQYH